jgi:phosphoribosylaminoimidazole-succinocarboxamide synthase
VTGAGALLAQGKVRDVYDAGDDRLLLVASDRISAFDVVLPTPIPDKGLVLTGLSRFWFDRTRELIDNHVVSIARRTFPMPFGADASLDGRAMLVRRAAVIPMECVARGYLSGSGWQQYVESAAVCGVPLPRGLRESDRLPEPIFTPTTKAPSGHDEPLSPDEGRERVGTGLFERLREVTLTVYEGAAAAALERGIILADTKLEFGFCGGELILIDELCTPDSSRFWPADGYEPGGPQPSFDKQYVRDWLLASGWHREPPAPELPAAVVEATASRYREAYGRLTGEPLDAYRAGVGAPPG